MKFLELQTAVSEMQNTLDVVNGRLDIEEIGELEGVVIEAIHNEQRKIFFFKKWREHKWAVG